jgi:hypothetical protein
VIHLRTTGGRTVLILLSYVSAGFVTGPSTVQPFIIFFLFDGWMKWRSEGDSVAIEKLQCLETMFELCSLREYSFVHLALFTGRALRRVRAATSPTSLLGGLSNCVAAGVAMFFVVAWEYGIWMIDDRYGNVNFPVIGILISELKVKQHLMSWIGYRLRIIVEVCL